MALRIWHFLNTISGGGWLLRQFPHQYCFYAIHQATSRLPCNGLFKLFFALNQSLGADQAIGRSLSAPCPFPLPHKEISSHLPLWLSLLLFSESLSLNTCYPSLAKKHRTHQGERVSFSHDTHHSVFQLFLPIFLFFKIISLRHRRN